MLFHQILFFFFLIFKVESSMNIKRPFEFCTPFNQENEIEEVATLKKSYICSEIEFLSQMENSVPVDVEEILISNSSLYSEEELINQKYFNLATIQIVHSFIGSAALRWLESLETLKSLSFMYSATGHVIESDRKNITVLDLKLSAFKRLQKLQIFKGNITALGGKDSNTLPDLDFSDSNFECSRDFIWLIELNPNKIVLNNTNCFMEKIVKTSIHEPLLYSLSKKSFKSVMYYKKEARDNCPDNCFCKLHGMAIDPTQFTERPQLSVDCIGLNMTKLPDVIPKGTSKCNFTYNFIEDLSPMFLNSLYDKVPMMALSHNNISVLDPVHFPEWLKTRQDVGFSLNHNRLQKFPAAAIKKIYEDPNHRFMPQFFLGHNPWICSCDYIADFQELIYQNMYDIVDARDIRCSPEDEYNANRMVLALDVGTLCSKDVKVNTYDVVNIMLGLFLLVLLCDFFYNWNQYTKKGKLPWIVTKFRC